MSDRLSLLAQLPRTVHLAGAPYQVFEARLADLLQLQAWLDEKAEGPLRSCLDLIDGVAIDDAQRDRLLFDALDSLDDTPATWFNAAGAARLYRGEGLIAFLTLALSRGTPGLTAAELLELVSSATAAEIERLKLVFFGVRPEKLLEGLLYDRYRAAPVRLGKPVTWLEAVADVAREYGWTFEHILGLSLTQFHVARSGGRLGDGSDFRPAPGRLDEVRQDILRRRQAAYRAGSPPADNGGVPLN